MKKTNFILLSGACLLVILATACGNGNGGKKDGNVVQAGVMAGVMFGNPGGGGDTSGSHTSDSSTPGCNGRGICVLAAVNAGKTTPVFFQLQNNSAALMLSLGFHLSVLSRNQPRQVDSFFRADCGTYQFQSNYPLKDSILNRLQLPKNPVITPKDSTSLKIVGDSVTIYIQFTHG